jgi:hypothetical protein
MESVIKYLVGNFNFSVSSQSLSKRLLNPLVLHALREDGKPRATPSLGGKLSINRKLLLRL